MYITRMRSPLRDAQTENPATHCQRCGGEVYPGETVYKWEDEWICFDCLSSKINRLLRDSPVLLAEELGVGTISI